MRDRAFLLGTVLVLAAILAVYSSHFENAFHFDDFHTITDNPYVKDVHNIPLLLSDSRTFSVRPEHASYRPLLAVSLAIDYWIGKGRPLWFQISTFLWFVVQLALMYFLFIAIMDAADPDPSNRWFALFAVALYALHPVSAETVNYIVQRSEIFTSIGVIAGLVLYIRFPARRRFGLYLIPPILGILCKPPGVIFAAILFIYILLFEEIGNPARAARRALPALAACSAAGLLVWLMTARTFSPGGGNPISYWLTQTYITWHYFRSFLWPSDLSADSDFSLFNGWSDPHVIFGILFIAALCVLARVAARNLRTRPIAFGISWFLLALLPVALLPLAEVENDHRMYFPFVGLTLAAVWAASVFVSREWRPMALTAGIVLILCGQGTWQRNQIWRTEESLWRDVAQKSPLNGRGLMNYGLTQMAKGDYDAALGSFRRALPLTPNYSLLHINIGIAEAGLHNDSEARQEFNRAIALAPDDSESYYYFARFLSERNDINGAIGLLTSGIQKNPSSMRCRTLLLHLYAQRGSTDRLEALLADSLKIAPNDPDLLALQNTLPSPQSGSVPAALTPRTAEDFVDLSLNLYRSGRFEESVNAARQALTLRPEYPEAYNNIAAGYNALGRFDEGIQAAREAVRLKPDFQLARNNLAWAISEQKRKTQH